MKALYTPCPGEFGLVDRPVPIPSATQALVKVARASICHTDVIIRSGKAGHVIYPVIVGHEFGGVVESVGASVAHIRPGDRVGVSTVLYCGQCRACRRGDTIGCEHYDELGSKSDGGFAEYCAVPAHCLYVLPDHVSLSEAALLEPTANAVSAVKHAGVKMGERVVVIGPGPIGLLVTAVASLARPATLVLVGTRDERLALGSRFGATHTLNIRKPGAADDLKEILGSRGADVVVECAGSESGFRLATEIVGWRGRIAVESVFETEAMLPISPYKLLLSKAVSIMGVCGWVTADFAQAVDLVTRGLIDVKPLVTHTFAIDEWEQAFEMVTERKSEAIKVQFAF